MTNLLTMLTSLLLMLPLFASSKENGEIDTDTSQEIAPEITPQEARENRDILALEPKGEKEELKARLPLNALRNFAEAFNRVSSAYVEEIDDRSLLENAIRGMLFQLDPHSVYLDKVALTNLEEKTTGNYGGLGIEVTLEDGFVKVIFDSKYGEWLGCHMIGEGVTDMISEAVLGRKLETTGHEVLKAVHPHPTMSEAVMEAVADAYDEVIHL